MLDEIQRPTHIEFGSDPISLNPIERLREACNFAVYDDSFDLEIASAASAATEAMRSYLGRPLGTALVEHYYARGARRYQLASSRHLVQIAALPLAVVGPSGAAYSVTLPAASIDPTQSRLSVVLDDATAEAVNEAAEASAFAAPVRITTTSRPMAPGADAITRAHRTLTAHYLFARPGQPDDYTMLRLHDEAMRLLAPYRDDLGIGTRE